MRDTKLFLAAVLGLLLSGQAFAGLTQAQRLADYHELVATVERNYAPLEWKQTTIHLDWKKHKENFETAIAEAKSDKEFYQLLVKFMCALKDAHVESFVPSNYQARLGFTTDLIEGKVVIDQIDRLRLPELLFPFKKGDQLLSIGGEPVEKIMSDIAWASHDGFKDTDDRVTAFRLTLREERAGLTVPEHGLTTVTALPIGASKPITVSLNWIYSGRPVMDQDDLEDHFNRQLPLRSTSEDLLGNNSLGAAISKTGINSNQMSLSRIHQLHKMGYDDMESPKTMYENSLPANFQRLNDKLPIKTEITSGIYEVGGKKIGLLRMPTYMVRDGEVVPETGAPILLMFYMTNIALLAEQTDVLVLDQTNNPGGMVDLLTEVTSLFVRESTQDILSRVRPSNEWLEMISGIIEMINNAIEEDPKAESDNGKLALALKARFENFDTELRRALTNKEFLTSPLSLNHMGPNGVIQPAPKYRYKKPILVLINEFDVSCADNFPAILQDAKVATLFGNRTMGGGGNVKDFGPLAHSHFKFNLTQSLNVRANGQYIENLGVTPDIPYKIKMDDFMNNYRSYFEAFTREAVKLAGGNPNAPIPAPKAPDPIPDGLPGLPGGLGVNKPATILKK